MLWKNIIPVSYTHLTNKFNFAAGDFFEDGTLKMRFTRFISLVPTTRTNDNANNSYLNAGISNLKLNSSN